MEATLLSQLPHLVPDLPQVSSLCVQGHQPCDYFVALAGQTPSVVQHESNLNLAGERPQARVSVRDRVKVDDLGGHQDRGVSGGKGLGPGL